MRLKLFSFLFLLFSVSALTAKEQLVQVAHSSPGFIIPITNSNLTLLSQAERDHFTLILLTSTDEKHACNSCHRIAHVMRKVAQAWIADYYLSDYLYFAEIDLIDPKNADVFNYLKLQTVPQLWLVPPTAVTAKHTSQRQKKFDEHGIEYFDNYDILLEPHAEFKLKEGTVDKQVFKMADWVAKTIQKRITIRQDNAYTKFIATFVATFSVILLIKKRGPGFITGTVTKKKIYKVVFFAYLLLLLGGFSFSLIKKVPFIAQNDKREPIYISGGTQYQFGVEMVLVSGVYGLLGSSLIFLVYLGGYKVSESSRISSESQKSVLIIISAATLYVLYSVLTSMFLRKDEWYPYSFLKVF